MGLSPDGQNYSFFSTKICLLALNQTLKTKNVEFGNLLGCRLELHFSFC